MAFRMGLVDLMEASRNVPDEDMITVFNTLPERAMVNEEEWKAIANYFDKNAPEELIVPATKEIDQHTLFEVSNYVTILISLLQIL